MCAVLQSGRCDKKYRHQPLSKQECRFFIIRPASPHRHRKELCTVSARRGSSTHTHLNIANPTSFIQRVEFVSGQIHGDNGSASSRIRTNPEPVTASSSLLYFSGAVSAPGSQPTHSSQTRHSPSRRFFHNSTSKPN